VYESYFTSLQVVGEATCFYFANDPMPFTPGTNSENDRQKRAYEENEPKYSEWEDAKFANAKRRLERLEKAHTRERN
jgi:hypothetical protein